MKVIRIEHKDTGIGVFRAYNGTKKMYDYRDRFISLCLRVNLMDEPHHEIGNLTREVLIENHRLICAFRSISAMKKWVRTHELQALVREWNMRIYEIEVDTPYIGRQQVVYEKGTEKSKEDITLTILMSSTMSSQK